MIINLYPDCLSNQMSDNDPRKGFLDKNKIREFPKYAFPLGFHPKFEVNRPHHELLPMVFRSGNDNSFLQYLIFWESLETQHQKAAQLYSKVQQEMDEQSVGDRASDDKDREMEEFDEMMEDNFEKNFEERKNGQIRQESEKREASMKYQELPFDDD